MNLTRRYWVLALWAMALLLTGCGGGASAPGDTHPVQVYISGQVQKGPFSIGSDVAVNELNASLNPTGKVYTVQTSDDLGHFAVASTIGTNLVEIVGDGFYMDELTGQLATSRILLRAVADLSVNAKPTVNILTSLQKLRLMSLLSQGKTYTEADAQSQTEVLAVFGIDSTKINSLTTLYSMQINGSTDADSVLLATSTILSKMATNAALANGTTQSAELSNYINTIASQLEVNGTIGAAINTARSLAATQIDLAAVRTNVETYYANKGVAIVAPKFEEWVDKSGTGILPQRLVPVTGLIFPDVNGASPAQLITSNVITIAGLDSGIVTPVTVSTGASIIKNNVAVTGTSSMAQDGDTIAVRATALGYGYTNTTTITVGSTTATWRVTTKPLGGTISGLSGAGLILQNNAGDSITIPAGSTSFNFNAPVEIGAGYNVTMLTPPTTPLQQCTVCGGVGTVMDNSGSMSVSSDSTCISAPGGIISVTCSTQSAIAYYSNGIAYIDATTGALSPSPYSTVGYSFNEGTTTFDPTGKFVYVSSGSSIQSNSIDANTGALTATGSPVSGSNLTIDSTGKFAYVFTNGGAVASGDVTTYNIDPITGALTSTGSSVTADNVIFDPTRKFVYVLIYSAFNVMPPTVSISSYSLSAAGVLTPSGTPVTGSKGGTNTTIAFDPAGKFAYVPQQNDLGPRTTTIYNIDSLTGALSAIGTIPGNDITFDPTGKFVYMTTSNASISSFSVNTSTGALTATGSAVNGNTIVFNTTQSGRFAYVFGSNDVFLPNGITNSLTTYSVDSVTGALTAPGTADPGSSITFDPSGKFAYVIRPSTNGMPGMSNTVSSYSVNQTTGVLTLQGTAVTIMYSYMSSNIVFDLSGKFVYLPDQNWNIRTYSIDPLTGALTATGATTPGNSIYKIIPSH